MKNFIKKSVSGALWEVLKTDAQKAMTFCQKLEIFQSVAEILALNPNLTLEDAKTFLFPSIKTQMPNPFEALLDVSFASERIIKAIKKKEKVVIFGDYDVDGATSSAILKKFFAYFSLDVQIYIPDRIKEGYGPNSNALLELKKQGAELVITVDCGTVAFEPLKKASDAGLEIVVIDHHIGVKEKPESIAVINPNRWDETSELTYLCGAGVVFMLIVAVNIKLKAENFYLQHNIKEPNLLSLVDLVALGTVCDVMPLIGLNRAFVKTGIEVIKAKTNKGIKALLSVAGVEAEITEFTLGFVLGPRINAGGRIGSSTLGANLLSTENEEEAIKIANELNELNAKRKEMEDNDLNFAINKIEREKTFENKFIFVEDASFHQGIIGILASRLKERYQKPCAVFSSLEGYLKASIRSVPNIDVGSIIHKANDANLLIAGGGHAMAGGLSVLKENYKKLELFFQENIEEKESVKTYYISSVLTPLAASVELVNQVKNLSPFGSANPKPIFLMQNLIVIKFNVLKEKHASFLLKDENSGKTIKAMFFKAFELGILHHLEKTYGKTVDVIGELEINEWNGNKTVQLNLIDIAL